MPLCFMNNILFMDKTDSRLTPAAKVVEFIIHDVTMYIRLTPI